MMHCDIITNDLSRMEQRLLRRVPPDHEDASWDGSYFFASDPHEMDDCLFLSTDALPMRRVDCCTTCGIVPPHFYCPEEA